MGRTEGDDQNEEPRLMIINIVNDYHLLAPNALGSVGEFMLQVNKIIDRGENLYSIGDNFDFANCDKDQLPFLYKTYSQFLKTKGVMHVDGNHCRNSKHNDVIVIKKTVLAHGDFEFWGEKKAVEYRSKSHGAGFLKRGLVVKAIEQFEKYSESKINEDFLERAYKLAVSKNCDAYICGHKHNKIMFSTIYKGIKIMVLPRGFNKIHMEV